MTLAELRTLKEKALENMKTRESNAKYRVVVAMGTCGIAAGAREVMSELLNALNSQHVTDVVVTQTGCLGYCDQEPLVQVIDSSGKTVTYGKVNREIVRKIVEQHILKGKILSDYVFMTE